MKVFSVSNKSTQELIRSIDKKSNYRFPFIDPPEDIEDKEKSENISDKQIKADQAA